jgi:hypothetical protein
MLVNTTVVNSLLYELMCLRTDLESRSTFLRKKKIGERNLNILVAVVAVLKT